MQIRRFTKVLKMVSMAFLLLSLFGVAAFPQAVNTRVNGTVKDAQGAIVAGATVTLVDNATGTSQTATTNDTGFFAFNDVRQGRYTLNVEASGFKKTTVADVEVNVDQAATVNVSLEVGQVSEVVNVSASDAQTIVNTENAEIKNTVQERQINDLPLNGRNPLSLAGLQAGVNSSGSGTRTASINGLRGTFSNLTWDGININDNFVRTDSLFGVSAPSVVSVSEFTITTQNSGPGDGLGVAQIKLATPRGTSDFRGSLFAFHRNDRFDANSFFNNRSGLPKEKLIQNQFGFGVGGPITIPNFGDGGKTWLKDKLFFYAYYEGTRERSDASVLRTVLDADSRQGNFTYIATCGAGTQPACPTGVTNGQAITVNLLNYQNRSIDPAIASLLALQPTPNNTEVGDARNTGGYRFNSPSGSDSDLWGFRLDLDANEQHRFEAIYSRFKFNFPNDTFNDIGEIFPGLPGGGQSSIRPRGSFAWVWVPTSNFNNELRGGFQSSNPSFLSQEDFDEGYRLTFPISTNPIQNFLPQGRNVKVWEVMDNAGYIWGDHSIRFGGNYRNLIVQPFNDAGILPTYALGFGTGNPNPLTSTNTSQFPGGIGATDFSNATALLALLTGSLNTVAQSFNVVDRTSGFVPNAGEFRDIRNFNVGLYAGDSWRARPNLTLNFGLRWEYISVPREENGLALLLTGGAQDLFNPNAILDFGGDSDRPFFPNDMNNFAPTVSFAWDPFGDGKTSVRGGYGISYVIDNNITTILNAIRGNPGLASSRSIQGLSGTVSGGGIQPITAPTFLVPRPLTANLAIDAGAAVFAFDDEFYTPYVQQWNVGVSREIFADMAVEVRYVGNRGSGLTRGIDYNQVRIFDNGFYEDFLRGQFNLANCGGRVNPTAAQCPNRQPLQLLPRFGLAGFLTNGTVVSYFQNGEVGELAAFYYLNRASFLNGANGGDPTLTPSFFARANPNAFVTDLYTNGSWSSYHGLQTEVRRRFRDGLYFQANYTFSKGLSDSEGSQTNFDPFLDLVSGSEVEKARITNDITHVFKANAIYELPFGPDKRFLSYDGFAGKLLGGWSVTGLLRWQSGEPISITSGGRGTLNRRARSTRNTVDTNLTIDEIQENTGIFFDPDTGQPRLFPVGFQSNFTNPVAGSRGSLALTPVSGPSVLFFDASLIKRTYLTERMNIELRLEAFNVLNKTNFNVAQTQSINSNNFGFITSTFEPRVLQFAAKFNF